MDRETNEERQLKLQSSLKIMAWIKNFRNFRKKWQRALSKLQGSGQNKEPRFKNFRNSRGMLKWRNILKKKKKRVLRKKEKKRKHYRTFCCKTNERLNFKEKKEEKRFESHLYFYIKFRSIEITNTQTRKRKGKWKKWKFLK